jgi:hypothetical protein
MIFRTGIRVLEIPDEEVANLVQWLRSRGDDAGAADAIVDSGPRGVTLADEQKRIVVEELERVRLLPDGYAILGELAALLHEFADDLERGR